MKEVRFKLRLTADQFRRYYSGDVKFVQTRIVDGRTIRFPASVLQPYLTHDGIEGEFVLQYGDNNKLISCNKID